MYELTQTMTADGKSETTKFHVTSLHSQDKGTGKWRTFHGHATLVSTSPGSPK